MGRDLTKKRNMKKIEVNGEYWEQGDPGNWRYQNSKDFMKVNGEFYIPQNKEFKSKLIFDDTMNYNGAYPVSEVSEGILKIGCSEFRVSDIEILLKEYREFKS